MVVAPTLGGGDDGCFSETALLATAAGPGGHHGRGRARTGRRTARRPGLTASQSSRLMTIHARASPRCDRHNEWEGVRRRVGSLAIAVAAIMTIALMLEVRTRWPQLYRTVDGAMVLSTLLITVVGFIAWDAKPTLAAMVVFLLLPVDRTGSDRRVSTRALAATPPVVKHPPGANVPTGTREVPNHPPLTPSCAVMAGARRCGFRDRGGGNRSMEPL